MDYEQTFQVHVMLEYATKGVHAIIDALNAELEKMKSEGVIVEIQNRYR